MEAIILEVKYFGMIAEKLDKESESIEFVFDQDEINLQAYFNSRYPQLQGLNYKTAVNQEIKSSIDKNSGTFEIALLPPFAGG